MSRTIEVEKEDSGEKVVPVRFGAPVNATIRVNRETADLINVLGSAKRFALMVQRELIKRFAERIDLEFKREVFRI